MGGEGKPRIGAVFIRLNKEKIQDETKAQPMKPFQGAASGYHGKGAFRGKEATEGKPKQSGERKRLVKAAQRALAEERP